MWSRTPPCTSGLTLSPYPEFAERTPNGTLGDATLASAEKGEKIVERCVDRIVAL